MFAELGQKAVKTIKKQRKPIDVPKRDFISLNIDLKQMGVGGDNSWGARTHDKYTLPMDTTIYNLEYALIPFNKENKLQELSRINIEH